MELEHDWLSKVLAEHAQLARTSYCVAGVWLGDCVLLRNGTRLPPEEALFLCDSGVLVCFPEGTKLPGFERETVGSEQIDKMSDKSSVITPSPVSITIPSPSPRESRCSCEFRTPLSLFSPSPKVISSPEAPPSPPPPRSLPTPDECAVALTRSTSQILNDMTLERDTGNALSEGRIPGPPSTPVISSPHPAPSLATAVGESSSLSMTPPPTPVIASLESTTKSPTLTATGGSMPAPSELPTPAITVGASSTAVTNLSTTDRSSPFVPTFAPNLTSQAVSTASASSAPRPPARMDLERPSSLGAPQLPAYAPASDDSARVERTPAPTPVVAGEAETTGTGEAPLEIPRSDAWHDETPAEGRGDGGGCEAMPPPLPPDDTHPMQLRHGPASALPSPACIPSTHPVSPAPPHEPVGATPINMEALVELPPPPEADTPRPLSLPAIFRRALALPGITLESFAVYSHIRRLGYCVERLRLPDAKSAASADRPSDAAIPALPPMWAITIPSIPPSTGTVQPALPISPRPGSLAVSAATIPASVSTEAPASPTPSDSALQLASPSAALPTLHASSLAPLPRGTVALHPPLPMPCVVALAPRERPVPSDDDLELIRNALHRVGFGSGARRTAGERGQRRFGEVATPSSQSSSARVVLLRWATVEKQNCVRFSEHLVELSSGEGE